MQASNDAHKAKCAIGGRTVCVLSACETIISETSVDANYGSNGSVDANFNGNSLKSNNLQIGMSDVVFKNGKLFLGCNDGAIEVLSVKPDGKSTMNAKAFAAGLQGIKKGKVTWSEA